MHRASPPILWLSFLVGLFILQACAGPKVVPTDLAQLKTPEALAAASQRSYQQARQAPEKGEKLRSASAGIAYAEKCLQASKDELACLYYQVVNTGIYLQNHIVNYQAGLKKMLANCSVVLGIDASYEHGGCARITGSIYFQAPGFSLNPKNVTQDMDLALKYFNDAVRVAPDYALNHLLYAKALEANGDAETAATELKEFDRLRTPALDSEYPEWKKERDQLAKKLHMPDSASSKANSKTKGR